MIAIENSKKTIRMENSHQSDDLDSHDDTLTICMTHKHVGIGNSSSITLTEIMQSLSVGHFTTLFLIWVYSHKWA